MSNAVDRKIYFYRIDAGRDENGDQISFDPIPTLTHLDRLTWTNTGRYSEDTEGNASICWIDLIAPAASMMRLGKSRRNALPHIESGGNLTDLALPAGSGLAEQIHIVFFPNNIVGADYNFYGPRLTSLKYYLADKAKGVCPPVTFEPLLRSNALAELNKLNDIRLFSLRIDVPSASAVAKADTDLGSLFKAAISLGHSEEIEIVIRPKPYSRLPIDPGFLQKAKNLAQHLGLMGGSSKLLVSGMSSETDKVEYIDVFKDNLVSTKKIVLMNDNTRALNRKSAYTAISEAYKELKDELLEAVGIRP